MVLTLLHLYGSISGDFSGNFTNPPALHFPYTDSDTNVRTMPTARGRLWNSGRWVGSTDKDRDSLLLQGFDYSRWNARSQDTDNTTS